MSSETKGIEEFEEMFRRDPADVDAFAALQQAYKHGGRMLDLAALMERRASHLRDGHKAADLLVRASELYAQQGQEDAESRALTKALEHHKGNRRALERLKELALQHQRWTDVLELLAVDAENLVEAGGDGRRLGRLEHEMGEIWEQRFHRLDQAIQHYQAAFKADPGNVESIEAGRRIYSTVGRWKTVAALYQVELSTCTETRRKLTLLLELGQLQWEKLGDLEGAARSYQEASQLRAGEESILESLGEIYASPEWPTPGGLDKAASIFMQIAQARQSRGDRDGAIAYLRRALGADPENEAAYNRLEKAYEETGRWEDLDRLYRQRLSVATEMEKVELLMRRGQLLERKLGDRHGARECYEEVLAHEPLGGPASNRLMQLYRADKDYDKLIELHQRALENTQDRATQIRLMLEISAIYHNNVGDHEAAAHLVHEVLQIEPDHRKALTAYEDYFRQKGDYRNLAELLRFAAQSAGQAGAPAMEVCARLEELADVSERHLGDLEGAIEAWQQIAKLHPDVQRSKEALGRLGAKLRMWQGMVNVLERELAQAVSPDQRLHALHRMAQVYYDKKADPQRTITILREVLDQAPHDESTLRMLVDLYEREGDFEGLAWALERKLAGIMTKEERANVLRRLGEIYAEKLERSKDALRVLNALLELAPADSKTHDRVQVILEKTDDLEGLARALELRAKSSRGIGERIEALKNLARLMDDDLDDPARAAIYWEEVRAQDPREKEALDALGRIYDRMARAPELLAVLESRLALSHEEAESPAQVGPILRRIGQVADERLGDEADAVRAYEELADLLPGDREATDALARLYSRLERHSELVEVLGRQIEQADDPEQRVVLAFKQGDVLEEKLGDLASAATVYEKIIDEYAPGDLDAHRKLKYLYLKRGDHVRACEIAERELFLTDPEAPDRLSLALEIAALWRETVQDDARAVVAYERVLELDPDSAEALLALRKLYHRVGAHHKLVKMAPALFAAVNDPQERLILLVEIAGVYEKQLHEPELAFEWYRRAHDLYPEDSGAIDHLRRLAQQYGLWEELITALMETRKRARGAAEKISLTRQVAEICRDELHDPARAFQVLQQTLRIDPTGSHVLGDLEQLADRSGQHAELLEIFDRAIQSVRDEPDHQRGLIRRRAELAEHKLGDPGEALTDALRLYGLAEDPVQAAVLIPEVDRLAQLSGQWERAIELHGRRYQQAESLDERLSILIHVARMLEDQMGDLGRAFMVWIQTFGLRPDDQETVGQLWRLASTLDQALRDTGEDAEEVELEELEMELVEDPLVIAPSVRKRRDTTIDDPTLLDSTGSGRRARSPAPPPPPPPGSGRRGSPPPIPTAQRAAFAPQPPPGFSPWQELARAYLRLEAPDRETKIAHHLEVVRIWSEGAHDLDRAAGALAEAATIDIEHPEVERLLLTLGDEPYDRFDDLVQIYNDALERSADAQTLVRLNIKLGDLLVDRDRPEQAAHHFAAVLAIVPTHRDAADRLRRLFQAAGRWLELASLLERQLEVLSDSLSPAERGARLLELADLYQHTLKRPIDAVDYLVRLTGELPQDLDVRVRLADLYEELSIWAKQIETLEAAIKISDSPETRVALLLRVAHTYEKELELPDRAIAAYQQILTEQPHNWEVLQALERLYEAHERHQDLLGVLRLQVELTDDAETARPLVVRLARALEQHGELAEAGTLLQRAREMGPRDPDIEEALARILVQTGRPDDAVELIHGQIEAAKAEGRPNSEVAGLLVRLARLKEHQLGDVDGARATLEQALSLDARHPEALETLAIHFRARESWGDYVEALGRLADVAPPEQEQLVPVLLAAAELVRDAAGDIPGAIRLAELALQRDPGHLPAVELLIELSDADPARQESFLLLKHDLIDDPHEQALTLTQLGRALERRGAPPDEVAQAYNEALALDGDLVPAIDALSALLVSKNELEPARILLVQAIERLGLSRDTGPLYYRLGQIFEQQGRDEDGYRYLMDALRLDSKNLHLRIAVGLNRFRAERWRESLRHLQEVEEHPGASDSPQEAAEALYVAGRCEVNLRRAERASRFYEAALALNPAHRGAIHELALTSSESGQWDRAATLLDQEVALTVDPGEQSTLLKRLGDIHRDHLADNEAAATCYGRLVELLPDEEAARLEVLPQILPTLRKAGRHATAAAAAEALAEVMGDEREKRNLLLMAAEELREAGDLTASRRNFEAALALDPSSLEAAAALSELLEADGEEQAVADLLGRVLSGAPPSPDNDDARALAAALHARLGRMLTQLGQDEEATQQLQRSLELAESADVRQALAGLYRDDPRHREAALVNHRKLLELQPWRADSLLALARASAESAPYRAYCFYQALQTLDSIDEEGVTFLANYTPPALEAEQPYSGEITDEERWSLLCLDDVQALREVFSTLWEAAPTLFSRDLTTYGITQENRLSPVADSNLAKIYSATARALGIKQTVVYLTRDPAAPELRVVCMAPPAVIVSEEKAAERNTIELRFLMGRALELTQPAYVLAAGLERSDFARLFSSVLKAFHPRFMRGRKEMSEEALEQAAKLRRNLPFKVTRKLGEIFRSQAQTRFDSGAWRRAIQLSANRVGLALCGDLGTAVRLATAGEPARPVNELVHTSEAVCDLLGFSVSDGYYAIRAKLGLADKG